MGELTDAAVRKAGRKAKAYYLGDGRGLWLYVSQTGGKYWRLRYSFGGRRRILSLGEYPGMGLAEARAAREAARAVAQSGRDPAVVRKAEAAARRLAAGDTFEVIAREWHAGQSGTWSPRHAADVIHTLEVNAFPDLGSLPIREITPPLVLEVIRGIEKRGAHEMAHRVRQRISAVFVYAIATARAEGDPAAIIQKALKPVVHTRLPAVRTIEEAREILLHTAEMRSFPVVKLAMRFLALTAMRPGPLVATPRAELTDLDPKNPVWVVPPARMKLRREHKLDETRAHYVPLQPQAIEVIEVLKPLTEGSPYLFPNSRFFHRPMTEAALLSMLNRAGYHGRHVPHGWRSVFSTVMNERRPRDREIIDDMLAHVRKDKVEAAYNRAEYMVIRREIAQEWADLLMAGQPPASSLLLGRRK